VTSVRAFARRHSIFRPGPIVLAVSGGTDSVALAVIMAELREEFGLLLHVAHFDHRARPRASAADAAFVAEIADRIGAPIRVGRAAQAPKSEDDARRDRYSFLRRAASEIGAGAIATGHTQDDQAETVLLHLVRGSGLAGAAAMRPLRDGIARPLLAIGRAETEAICRAAGIRPREDPTNASLKFARNRIRHRVMPELEKLNPQVRGALARFAEAAAEVESALSSAGDPAAIDRGAVYRDSLDRNALDRKALDIADLPSDAAPRARSLSSWWHQATGVTLSSRHRVAILDLVSTTAGSRRIDLPGGQAIREYGVLRAATAAAGTTSAGGTAGAATTVRSAGTARAGGTAGGPVPNTAAGESQPLERGKVTRWHGWRIGLDVPNDGLPFSGLVDARTATRLRVRGRRPGDRIATRGKLQDVFVNAKVPARMRDGWPLVTLDEQVLWAPGLTPAPRSGRIGIEAGPVENERAAGDSDVTRYYANGRVASSTEHRPRGGNREHA
jgi:tRNA(Ile)-lysidine synthetase-like protein